MNKYLCDRVWTAGRRRDQNTFVWKPEARDATRIEAMTYTHWKDNEPNNRWREDCVELIVAMKYKWNDARWNDERCTTKSCYLCEINGRR